METTQTPTTADDFNIADHVYYHGLKCIVTNKVGRYLVISPVGNGENPAQYYQVKPENISTFAPIDFTRINNDVNGNPRYACHFLEFVNDADRAKADELEATVRPFKFSISHLYDIAVRKANKIGGRKFHNKQYGGGIVFQSYNTGNLSDLIREIKKS